jgi:hypothetical protein
MLQRQPRTCGVTDCANPRMQNSELCAEHKFAPWTVGDWRERDLDVVVAELPPVLTITGADALDVVVGLLRAEELILDMNDGVECDAREAVNGAICNLWHSFAGKGLGSMFLGEDCEPSPLYARAERAAA